MTSAVVSYIFKYLIVSILKFIIPKLSFKECSFIFNVYFKNFCYIFEIGVIITRVNPCAQRSFICCLSLFFLHYFSTRPRIVIFWSAISFRVELFYSFFTELWRSVQVSLRVGSQSSRRRCKFRVQGLKARELHWSKYML